MSCQVLSVRSCQTADTSEVFVVMRQPSPTVTWDSYYELQGRADLCLYLYWEIPTPPQHRKLTNMIFLPSSNYRADTIRTTGTLYTHLYNLYRTPYTDITCENTKQSWITRCYHQNRHCYNEYTIFGKRRQISCHESACLPSMTVY